MNYRDMMLANIIKGLMIEKKELKLNLLPTQGYFYPVDMRMFIKAAEIDDILDYEKHIDRSNIIKSIECIKKVVQKNVSFNGKWCYEDLKSVDIIFIFIEIVKFTQSKDLFVNFVDDFGKMRQIAFGPQNFDYFDFSPFLEFYNLETREFIIDGWHYSFPSIGVENSLTRYLSTIYDLKAVETMKKMSYNFLFFLTGKNHLSDDEIQNVIQIFNYDLAEEEKDHINNIVMMFNPILSYALRYAGNRIEIKSKVNLESIWHL